MTDPFELRLTGSISVILPPCLISVVAQAPSSRCFAADSQRNPWLALM